MTQQQYVFPELSHLNSNLNVTELPDADFQTLVAIYELADRAAFDQMNPLAHCEAIASLLNDFFEERGIYSVYDHETDTYHYGTEQGGN